MRVAIRIAALASIAACQRDVKRPVVVSASDGAAQPIAATARSPVDAAMAPIDGAAIDPGVGIVDWSPPDGFQLPMPAVLPCERATSGQAGTGFGDASLVLLDDRGAAIGRLDSRADDVGQPVAVDLRALRAVAYAGGEPVHRGSGAWLRLECAHGQTPQVSWFCDDHACQLGVAAYVDRAAPRSLERRIPARCEAAAAGDRPLGGCRSLMTGEANLLLAELADVLASACDGGACSDELADARRTVDELVGAGPLRYRSTAVGPPLYSGFDEDDPPPPVRRHAFTAGATTVIVRCWLEVSEEADYDADAEIECRMQVPAPRGPLLFMRDTGHDDLAVNYLGGQIFLRGGAIILSDDAVRVRR